jgi:glutathione synthase/RimK-type ligase-like ATP-grasp enzyme
MARKEAEKTKPAAGRKKPGPVIVTDLPPPPQLKVLKTMTAIRYLKGDDPDLTEETFIVNLCRSYQYLSKGYYVSLLADARDQQVSPSLDMIEDLTHPYAYLRLLREAGIATVELSQVRGRRLAMPRIITPTAESESESTPKDPASAVPMVMQKGRRGSIRYEPMRAQVIEATCIFGKTLDETFARQASAVYRVYPFPLLKIRLLKERKDWKICQLYPVSFNQLQPEELDLLGRMLESDRIGPPQEKEDQSRPWSLACLWDPDDPFSPSDEPELEKFARAAQKQGLLFERIGPKDLNRVGEFDALFLRTLTGIDRYSYLFAQTAESLDMPVIDDPQSIVRCSNKVYLHELFEKNGLPTPKSQTITRQTPARQIQAFGFPLIVKSPDGSFSQAVRKARDMQEYKAISKEMFKRSALLIVQEFIPTAFDWRIGVLDNKILYACRYYMARNHWQIIGRSKKGTMTSGKEEGVRLEEAPQGVRGLALAAAELIGDGLYGVDIKETDDGPVVIEVNDNPDIHCGIEDSAEKEKLYQSVIGTFKKRINERASS